MKNLPPLKALRAFEACFRFNSYTKAADSLNVGQPAISHQIRSLEQDLGRKLFEKRGALIEPTADAKTYYAAVQPALAKIAEASVLMRDQGNFEGFHIGAYPGLASYWLSSRMAQLSQDHPEVSVRILTAEIDKNLSLDDMECSILFGDGTWPDVDCRKLIPEEVVAVCSKQMYDKWHQASAQDLLTKAPLVDLLDNSSRWFNWTDWQHHVGAPDVTPNASFKVFNHGLALHHAVTGQGIALAWRGVVQDMLDEGVVHALPFEPLTSDRGYYLLARHGFLATKTGEVLLSYLN